MEHNCVKDLSTFGTCIHGKNCFKSPSRESPKTRYFVDVVTKIEKDDKNNIIITFGSLSYFVPSRDWYQNGVQVNDMVVFHHKCQKPTDGRKEVGRVAFILHRRGDSSPSLDAEWNGKFPEFRVTEQAFTLDAIGTRNMEDAFSVERCKRHRNCKEIGIHVIAAAANRLQKVGHDFLPCFPWKNRHVLPPLESWKGGNVDPHSLSNGKDCLAISVFFHSGSEDVSGPTITVLKSTTNYFFDAPPEGDRFDALQDRFVNSKTMVAGNRWKYILEHPDNYKRRALLDAATSAYLVRMKSFLNSKTVYVITKESLMHNESGGESKAVLPSDWYRAADDLLRRSPEEAVHRLVAGVKHLAHRRQESVHRKDIKYTRNVQCSPTETPDISVVCTSPILKMECFINQQILLASLLGLGNRPIYSKEDLLGMLAIRYETPCMTQALVTTVRKATSTVGLHYEGESRISPDLAEISLQRLGVRVLRWKGEPAESADVKWENVRCNSPCYREIMSLNVAQYNQFVEKWLEGDFGAEEITAEFRSIEHKIAPSPFKAHDNPPSLELDLKPDIYLQIQISKNDADKNNGLGVRMIRFGPQCHVCLLHMNHPENAFMTDREDLKDKIPNNLDAGKHGVECLAEISWDGDYYSGGWFDGKEPTIQEGDFLCIRKETESIRGKEYVWNAHAVVLEVNTEGKVRFATCTLLQMEELRSTGEFVIEVIKAE